MELTMVRPVAAISPQVRRKRNVQLLRQLERSRDANARLRWRNALVTANLPLARSVAARMRTPRGGSYDDLLQVASLGLIRAVEAFDTSRSVGLSSFAVPYMRGALLHDLRDREPLVRIPRSLWELRQQACRLQDNRRGRGQAPLDRRSLARLLRCSIAQVTELEGISEAAHPKSLDAPLGPARGEAQGPEASCLLDQLADPRSLGPRWGDEQGEVPGELEGGQRGGAELIWLRGQLASLDPLRRELVEGRLNQGCTWVELGLRLGIHPRMAQRRCDAALAELRKAAAAWQANRPLSPATLPAAPVPPAPGPAPRPAGSEGH
jgi:RNA polymerase sigma-B factor